MYHFSNVQYWFCEYVVTCVGLCPSFCGSAATPLSACEPRGRRQRLAGCPVCPDWSDGGSRAKNQNTLQPISALLTCRRILKS